jgi:hypothetical protein
MNETDIAELQRVVERVHACPATYRTSETVRDRERQVDVAVFDILGHPRAMLCYAWFMAAERKGERRALTVLKEGPIHTSVDAVRFALDSGE